MFTHVFVQCDVTTFSEQIQQMNYKCVCKTLYPQLYVKFPEPNSRGSRDILLTRFSYAKIPKSEKGA